MTIYDEWDPLDTLTPEERAEYDAWCRAREAESLALQMVADAPYDVPPWILWTHVNDLPF